MPQKVMRRAVVRRRAARMNDYWLRRLLQDRRIGHLHRVAVADDHAGHLALHFRRRGREIGRIEQRAVLALQEAHGAADAVGDCVVWAIGARP